jgi:hypothetical protein
VVTDQTTASNADAGETRRRPNAALGRTLLWLGVAGGSIALTVALLRLTMLRPAVVSDETTERIQALIDEANRLIKTLDEKKQA